MKNFKFFLTLIVAMFLAFTACEKDEENKAISVAEPQQLNQSVFADEEQGKNVDFKTDGAWTASVTEQAEKAIKSTPAWISVTPDHGDAAGNYTINIGLLPNYTEKQRSATITIICNGEKIEINITQDSKDKNGETLLDPEKEDITKYFDPDFAKVLQEEGYISNANKIIRADVDTITNVDVFNKKLTSLAGIEYFEALTRFDCPYNQLTTLDVSKNTALTELSCSGNSLTTLDVSKNTVLTELECDYNPLTALDVSKNTALTGLYCAYNQLATLDVSKNTALTELVCIANQLTTLDVSKNTALTWLNCNTNQLTALDVSKNTALTELSCSGNSLTTLDISKNTAMPALDCRNNQLTTLDISKNTALTLLGCSGNPGDGTKLIVKAWFDNNTIPSSLTNILNTWTYNGQTISLDFQKVN
jgi:hypothetical protein